MSLTLHPRVMTVDRARNELSMKLCEIWERERLTACEVVAILAEMTHAHTRYQLREERHPDDPSKKSGEL